MEKQLRRIGETGIALPGEAKAFELEHGLLAECQAFPRSHETSHVGRLRQKSGEKRSGGRNVLEVVKDEKQPLVAKMVDQLSRRISAAGEREP